MDNLTKEQRTRTMRAIKAKDTAIEMKLRKALWIRGFRYRKHLRNLPGTPDIAFPKQRIAIFCDSEFWHGYDWEKNKNRIKSNREYWIQKIERNIERDAEVNDELERLGWKVLRFWGEKIEKDVEGCIKEIQAKLSE